jgi:diguanylate cyclase (GGDEF)-like protein/PAS domain S-box-containing protein
MVRDRSAQPTPGDGDDSGDRSAEITAFSRQWTAELANTSPVSLPRTDVERLLHDITVQLLTLLDGQPFDPTPAEDVGAQLVMNNFTDPRALARTVSTLSGLATVAGLPDNDTTAVRLSALTDSIVTGYVHATRDRLFDEQELIKKAVFRAQDVAEHEQRTSETKFRAVVESSPSGMAITDLDGNIQIANGALADMLGRPSESLAGSPLMSLLDPADAPAVLVGLTKIADGEIPLFVGTVNAVNAKGDVLWARLRLSRLRDSTVVLEQIVATVEDISDLVLLRENQLTWALRDQLTGLPNQVQLMADLDRAIAHAAPDDRIALCYVDLDGFKVITDGAGRRIGDQMLRRVAEVLDAEFGEENELVARVGGDGFAVLITGTARRSYEISQRIQQVLDQLAEPVWVGDDLSVGVLASVGIVERPADGMTSEDLLRSAELTVHRAKASGKAQWMLHDEDLDRRDRNSFRLAVELPSALREGQFVISYQPVVRLAGPPGADCGEHGGLPISAVRARLHWQHPERGLLRPVDFLGLGEQTGFVLPLQLWMLRQVCAQLRSWQREFGAAAPSVGITLATRLAGDQDLVRHLRDAIADSGADPEGLMLGIPAGVAFDERGELLENLDVLADTEFRVFIEDFGGAEYRLAALRPLSIHGVILSPAMIDMISEARDQDGAEPETSPAEHALRQLVVLTHRRGLQTIADGVDTAPMADRLAELGVAYGSGSALGEPLSPDGISAIIEAAGDGRAD